MPKASITLPGSRNSNIHDTAYTFTVAATNSVGTGSASTASDSIYVPPQVVFNIPDSSATLGSGPNAVLARVVSGGFGSFTAQIDWGDSTSQAATVTGNSVVGDKHTYDSTGSYAATITVTDSFGQQASDSIVFNVTGANATVTIPSVGTSGIAAIAISIIAIFAWVLYRRNRIAN